MTSGGKRKPRYGFGDVVMLRRLPRSRRSRQPDNAGRRLLAAATATPRQALDCRDAVPEFERRSRPGIFRRRHGLRGFDQEMTGSGAPSWLGHLGEWAN